MKRINLAIAAGVLALASSSAAAQSPASIVPSPVPALSNGCTPIYNSTLSQFECLPPAAASQPLSDAFALMSDGSNSTKILAFELSAISPSTTRTVTWPDANLTIPSTVASLAANTFTGLQTMNGGLSSTTGAFSSTLGVTGATTLSSTLAVGGTSTLAAVNATTGSFSSTLSVTGLTTFATEARLASAKYLQGFSVGAGVYRNLIGLTAASKVEIDSAGVGVTLAAGAVAINNGMTIGSPTGGDKGAGTLNATAVYDDNVLLTDWVFDLYYEGDEQARSAPASSTGEPWRQQVVIPRSTKRLYSLDEVRKVTSSERRLPWMPTKESFEQQRAAGWMITSLWQGQEQQQLYLFEHASLIAGLESQLMALARRVLNLEAAARNQ